MTTDGARIPWDTPGTAAITDTDSRCDLDVTQPNVVASRPA